jgi:hypothetical protein
VSRLTDKSAWILLLLLLVLTAIYSSGCGSLEASDNASARPWNAPAKWETGGLPSSMTEGR